MSILLSVTALLLGSQTRCCSRTIAIPNGRPTVTLALSPQEREQASIANFGHCASKRSTTSDNLVTRWCSIARPETLVPPQSDPSHATSVPMHLRTCMSLLLPPILATCSVEDTVGARPAAARAEQIAAAPVTFSLIASNPDAGANTRIAVGVVARSTRGEGLGSIKADLRYEPATVRYLGVAVPEHPRGPIVARDQRGTVSVVAVAGRGLDSLAAVLIFEVLKATSASTIQLTSGMAGTAAFLSAPIQISTGLTREPNLAVGDPTPLSDEEWGKRLGTSKATTRAPALTPGVPAVYGDATRDGAIDVFDALRVANIAVHNLPMPAGDTLEVSNVTPFNTADGIEATLPDPCRPGRICTVSAPFSETGPGVVNVLDAQAIAQYVAAFNVPVIGKLVPMVAPWPRLTTVPMFDSTKLVQATSDLIFFRTEIKIRFQDTISDSAKLAFFSARNLQVISEDRTHAFYVRIPDPGTSYAAFTAAIAQLRAAPEIALVIPIIVGGLRPTPSARFPTDGQTQKRSDWLNSATGTWGARAVRLPLAWGCENGEYGGTPLRIGVLEYHHDSAHPEWLNSSPTHRIPDFPDSVLARMKSPVQLAPQLDSLREHATAVTGMVTAEGDNGSGVAGTMWQTKLFLYDALSPGNRLIDFVSGFYKFTELMFADGIQVLNISIDAELKADLSVADQTATIQDVARSFRDLFIQIPALIVVISTGNDHDQYTVQQYLTRPKALILHAALLLLHQDPSFRDRIVFVGGSAPGRAYWTGSTFFTGETDLLAPASQITTLALRSGPSIPLKVWDGTSFAAPLVAGVAAQLLTMDPTLTPAQVKDYLLRGAQVPRPDSTGAMVTPSPVSGAPGTAYQLDAYGSLTLLADERNGAHIPICGNRVGLDANGEIAIFKANGAIRNVITTLDFGEVTSVAQGGRKLAVVRTDNSPTPQYYFTSYSLIGGAWSASPPDSGVVTVQFLERDTAIIRQTALGNNHFNGPLLLTIPGRVQDLDLGLSVGDPDKVFEISVAPDGQWVAFHVAPEGFRCCFTVTHNYYVDSIGRGSPQLLYSHLPQPTCGGHTCYDLFQDDSRPLWNHDSRSVTTAVRTYDEVYNNGLSWFYHTHFVRFSSASHGVQLSSGDYWAIPITTTSDDILWKECRSVFATPDHQPHPPEVWYRLNSSFSELRTDDPGECDTPRAIWNAPTVAGSAELRSRERSITSRRSRAN